MVISSDGLTLYAAGATYSTAYGDRDHVIFAMPTSGGTYTWYKRYGCADWDFLSGIILDTTNRYLHLSGGTSCFASTANTWDVAVFKYDTLSNKIEWGIYMGSPNYDDYSYRMAYAKYDGSVYVQILTRAGNNVLGGGLAKISSKGILEYIYKFGGQTSGQDDECHDVETNEDGRIVFFACHFIDPQYALFTGTWSAWLIKFNGVKQTVILAARFDYERYEYTWGIARDANGFIAWSYTTQSTNYNWAYWNYDSTLGITNYYESMIMTRLSPEMNDFNFQSSVSITPVAITDWKLGKMSEYIEFQNINMNQYQSQVVGQSLSISLNRFCYGSTMTYIDTVGYDYDSTNLPSGLTFNWATQLLSGKPTTSGVYAIKVYKNQAGNFGSSTFLLTITGGGSVSAVQDFFMDPSTISAGNFYYYYFDPTNFFNDDGTLTYNAFIYTKRSTNSSTTLPSWLKFTTSNTTFHGTFSSSDLGNQIFPIIYEIFLKVTDSKGTTTYSTSDYLTITNQSPYINPLIKLPTKFCLATAEPLLLSLNENYFLDDDDQTLTTSLNIQPSGSFPTNGLYYDTQTNLLFGTPTADNNYNMFLQGSDGFASAQFYFQVIVTARPYYDITGYCKFLRNIVLNRPGSKSYNFRQCLLDSGNTLQYSAKLSDGGALPDYMSINEETGELLIDANGDHTAVIYSVVVYASQRGQNGCFVLSFVSTITINTPVKVIKSPSTIKAIAGRYFRYSLDMNEYFYDPDFDDELTITTTDLEYTSMGFSPIGNILFGIPQSQDANTNVTVTLLARDRAGTQAQVSFKIWIIEVNCPTIKDSELEYITVSGHNFTFYLSKPNFQINQKDSDIYFYFAHTNGTLVKSNWIAFDHENFTISGSAPVVNSQKVYEFKLLYIDTNQCSSFVMINITIVPIKGPQLLLLSIQTHYYIHQESFFSIKLALEQAFQTSDRSRENLQYVGKEGDSFIAIREWPAFVKFNQHNTSLYGYLGPDIAIGTRYTAQIYAVDTLLNLRSELLNITLEVIYPIKQTNPFIPIAHAVIMGVLFSATVAFITSSQRPVSVKRRKAMSVIAKIYLNDSMTHGLNQQQYNQTRI